MEELLSKYFAGEASASDKQKVNSWRADSQSNAREFLEFKTVWLESEIIPVPKNTMLDEILCETETKIIPWPSFLKYAAGLLLIGLLGSLWYFNNSDSKVDNVAFGGNIQELPDGSIVTLKDGASLLTVDFTSSKRTVIITGKAFFEVERDEDRPFSVITDDATVQVLGTSFLVNNEDDFTEVCVETGLVSFMTNDPSKNNMSVNLEPGEMGVIGKDLQGIVKRKNDNMNFLAWKDGDLSFNRAMSTEVVEVLKDVYGKDFELPQNLKNCRLTAKFNKKSFEEVIQIISATFNWKYEIIQDKVVLSGEGC